MGRRIHLRVVDAVRKKRISRYWWLGKYHVFVSRLRKISQRKREDLQFIPATAVKVDDGFEAKTMPPLLS